MHSTIEDLLPILERIANSLAASVKQTSPEGFFDYGRKIFCNLTKGNGDGWYTFKDGAAKTEPPICCGRLVSVGFPTVERRGQEIRKFHLKMRVQGELITFESGFDCFFSKTILSAFAAASPEVLTQPVRLTTYPKQLRTGDRTLAVTVRDNAGNQLSAEWSNDDDWSEIARAAIDNVKAATATL